MEFKVVTVKRNLDLSENYAPSDVGTLQIGLQGISDDVAELEVHGPEGITKVSVPIGTAVTAQGYTIINRDVGVVLPREKQRRRFRRDVPGREGVMEAMLDVRWGDQAMHVEEPEKNTAYDFMLVRQYVVVADRPMVYRNQDVLQFGDLRLEMGERIEKDSKNYKKQQYAELLVIHKDDDEPEAWQIKLDGKYHNKEGYRVRITSYDWENEWYQAYGISIVRGRPKDYQDESEDILADGIEAEAHVGHTDAMTLSATRLEEAENNPDESIFKEGESRNVGKVGIKLLKMKPGAVQVMLLSPKVKKATLVHGQVFDFDRYEVSLVGVHGDKAIIRVVED